MKRMVKLFLAASLFLALLASFAFAEGSTLGGAPTAVENIHYAFALAVERDPLTDPLPDQTEMHLTMMGNEWEAYQFLVKTDLQGQSVKLDATFFKDNSGNRFPAKAYRVDYTAEGHAVLTQVKKNDVVTLTPGQTQAFIIEPHVLDACPVGEYSTVLKLRDAEGNMLLEKTVTATVCNFYLPDLPFVESSVGTNGTFFPTTASEESSFFGWAGYSYDYFRIAYELLGEEWVNLNFNSIINDLENVTSDLAYLKEARLRLARALSGDMDGFVGIDIPETVEGAVLTSDLKFGEDGTFTILTFADFQDENGMPLAEDMKTFIRNSVCKTEPDLIVLLGDNICSDYGDIDPSKNQLFQAADYIAEYMQVFEELGVPVAAVFGNHDSGPANWSIATKELQMILYQTYDCFIGVAGPDLTGVGNHNIPIMSSDGNRIAFNLWFIDSGAYNQEGEPLYYTAVAKDQIEWYIRVSNELKEANGGQLVPSFMFQHIPVMEILDAFVQTETGWTLPEGSQGVLRGYSEPATFTYGQFDAVKQQGDVIAMVTGHDHTNAYVVPYQGIDFVSVPTCSTELYPDRPDFLGTCVLVLNENDPTNYEARFISFADYLE